MIRTVARRVALERPISTRLRWTAAYFRWCAVLSAAFLVVCAVLIAGYAPVREDFENHPMLYVSWLLVAALTTAGWWFTGQTLRERRRIGGWLALATMLPPIAETVARHGEWGAGLTVPVLGTLAVLSCWRELE